MEKDSLGIRQFDVILVTGDAYIDHPSFGTALIGRVLWDRGITVGIYPGRLDVSCGFHKAWKTETVLRNLIRKCRLYGE
jgi:hypothetical protein